MKQFTVYIGADNKTGARISRVTLRERLSAFGLEATIIDGEGYSHSWGVERSAVVTIIGGRKDLSADLTEFAKDRLSTFDQSCILVTEQNVEGYFYKA